MLVLKHVAKLVAKECSLTNLCSRAAGKVRVPIDPVIHIRGLDKRIQIYLEGRVERATGIAIELLP